VAYCRPWLGYHLRYWAKLKHPSSTKCLYSADIRGRVFETSCADQSNSTTALNPAVSAIETIGSRVNHSLDRQNEFRKGSMNVSCRDGRCRSRQGRVHSEKYEEYEACLKISLSRLTRIDHGSQVRMSLNQVGQRTDRIWA
jgi:hypothetical protein